MRELMYDAGNVLSFVGLYVCALLVRELWRDARESRKGNIRKGLATWQFLGWTVAVVTASQAFNVEDQEPPQSLVAPLLGGLLVWLAIYGSPLVWRMMPARLRAWLTEKT